LTAGTGISTSGTYPNFTITNSAPDQTVALTGAGTTSISGTYPNFTITSNDAFTGTVTSVTGTSPVASSGGTTPAISLAASYGDTQNPYASKTANFVLAAPNGSAGVPTFRAVVAADIPTLNQNTTGTASNVTGTVAIANGGTGQTSATAAFDALAPSQTSNSGKYLTTNGTTTSWGTVSITPTSVSDQNNTSTGYFDLPSGTTAQRPASPVAGMIRHNTTLTTVEFYDGVSWQNVLDGPYSVEVLLVAGGGGTTRAGGGAGGLLYYGAETPKTPNGAAIGVSPKTAYSIVIGAGGASGANNGVNTTGFGFTAIGGGYGASSGGGAVGGSGGSGGGQAGTGGGGPYPNTSTGTAGQGNDGGDRSNDNNDRDGGGGGAGAVGGNGNGSGASGSGGNGLQYSISGTATYYAGGGAGVAVTQGVGGLGGGGGSTTTNAGTANTGGGGSGSGGSGGSGIVVLRYLGGQRGTGGTVTSAGGYTIHTFTSSGTFTA